MNQTMDVQEVETEEITFESELQQKISKELVKRNVTDAVISKLKGEFAGLTLKSPTDKESYLQLKESRLIVRKVEILGEKAFKKLKEYPNQVRNYILDKEKEFANKFSVIYPNLDEGIKTFEDEVERKENEEKELKEKAFQHRQGTLIKYGAQYNNGSFELNHISYEIGNIKDADEEIWESIIIPKYKAEFEKVQAEIVRQEEERKAAALKLKEEQDELNRQREEMDKQRKELADQQAAMQKLKDDSEREQRLSDQKMLDEENEKRNKVVQARINRLYSINILKSPYIDKSYSFVDDEINYSEQLISNKISIPADLFSLYDSEWDNLVEELSGHFQKKKKEVIEKRIADTEAQRQIDIELALQTERERVAEQKRLSDIKEAKQKQIKEEELSQGRDKRKWEEFLRQLNEVEFMEMNSTIYKRKVAIAKEKISEIVNL